VVVVFAACASVLSLLRLESVKLAAAVGGFLVPAFIFFRFGSGYWLSYLSLAACFTAVLAFCRVSPFKLAVSYLFGGVVGVGTSALFSHAASSGGLSPWIAMAYGVFLVSLIAYLIGVQALKLHGHYLAMATMGFGVIVSIVLLQWEPVTGGTSGIYGIPNLQILGRALDKDVLVYYLVWTIVVGVIALSANIVNSRIGRAFRAVHGSEVAASTLGVDTARYKVQVFVLSAALASIAGSLYSHYVTFISPEPFGFKFSTELVVMVVVGGMASVWGAIFGAGVITALGEALRYLEQLKTQSLGFPISDLDVVLFGLILMLIMIYLPQGLVRGVADSVKFAMKFGRRRKKGGR
jgi:branched-chain amino acid transport system permease protein